jgi:hypothetical protein
VHTLSEAQSDPLPFGRAAPSRIAADEKQIEVDGEKSGSTLRSTLTRSCCWKLTRSAAAGLIPRQRSGIDSQRTALLPTQRFSPVLAAI